MNLSERIQRAVENTIDPMAEMPFLANCPMEEVHPLVDEYLHAVQDQLLDIITRCGDMFLQTSDAAGLCATCLAEGIDLPPDTLLRTCQAIIEDTTMRAEYIGDMPNGDPVYMVALEV